MENKTHSIHKRIPQELQSIEIRSIVYVVYSLFADNINAQFHVPLATQSRAYLKFMKTFLDNGGYLFWQIDT